MCIRDSTITSPQAIILSKMIYNFMLMGVLSLLCLLVFTELMGGFVVNYPLFISALLLGSFGFASALTMIAAIASRTNNNFALMAILSFPVVMPLLLTLMKVSSAALSAVSYTHLFSFRNYFFFFILLTTDLKNNL